jgi:tetratricopeptide (TPR) repeat protein
MVYEWRGVAFQSVGSFQPAIDDFSRGITMSPAKPSLYVNRGKAYKELGMQQKAADDFLKARQLGVNIPDAQFK